jgi:hypothetical protein
MAFLFWILVESIQANKAGISITSKKFLNERIMIKEKTKEICGEPELFLLTQNRYDI